MMVGGQHHDPAALPQVKTRYPLCRRLGEFQGRSGPVRKISSPPGSDPRSVQSVAGRYNDCAIRVRAHTFVCVQYVITDLPSVTAYSKVNKCFSEA